jgi:hypothetical protein
MVVFHTITHENVRILLLWNISLSKKMHSKTIFIPPALPSHQHFYMNQIQQRTYLEDHTPKDEKY